MKLYVCYGTWTAGAIGSHTRAARRTGRSSRRGTDPDVIRTYGLGDTARRVQRPQPGRREVKELTGNYWVPVLVTDDDAVVQGSERRSPGRGPTRRARRRGAA